MHGGLRLPVRWMSVAAGEDLSGREYVRRDMEHREGRVRGGGHEDGVAGPCGVRESMAGCVSRRVS